MRHTFYRNMPDAPIPLMDRPCFVVDVQHDDHRHDGLRSGIRTGGAMRFFARPERLSRDGSGNDRLGFVLRGGPSADGPECPVPALSWKLVVGSWLFAACQGPQDPRQLSPGRGGSGDLPVAVPVSVLWRALRVRFSPWRFRILPDEGAPASGGFTGPRIRGVRGEMESAELRFRFLWGTRGLVAVCRSFGLLREEWGKMLREFPNAGVAHADPLWFRFYPP